jgi:hypothetical protein
MSTIVAMMIETMVAGLLAVTIGYCILLDRRLQRLRADEHQMRTTVVELGLATERAERAIEGLSRMLADCDASLGERLRSAERTTADLEGHIRTGDDVLARISKIVNATKMAERAQEGKAPAVAPRLADTVAAAQAFAIRTKRKHDGLAA